ncbi:MAG: glycosyltransferase family 39 protein [Cyclobacteriaceae bacterium]|nr:glycosyltransferase family 39 protein [Cyclobacteriaceae bacterium]
MNKSNYAGYTLLVVASVSILKILFTATTELSLFTEEAQYWLWSQNLDWNYYSKPLMIAVYNFISTSLLGNNEVAVRLPAIVFGAATAWVVYAFTLRITAEPKYAFISVLMLLVMPFYHLGTLFHTTDSSLIFCWALTYYLIWRALQEQKTSLWVLAGLATALGIASKSIMVLAVALIFLHLLMKDWRQLLKKDFYLYGLVAALGLVPLVIWNFQHDFVTFKHIGTLGGVEGEREAFSIFNSLKYVGEYVGGQLGFFSVLFIPLLLLAINQLHRFKDEVLRYLLLPVGAVWLMFLLIAINKRVEVNWPAFAVVLLPVAFAYTLHNTRGKWMNYTRWAIIISGILIVLIMKPAPLDAVGFTKVLRPAKDPLARLAGYRQAGERVSFLIDSLQLQDYFIFSNSYHIASEMAFYVRDNPLTYCINLGRRKNQYDLWPGISQYENKGYTGIYITSHLPDTPAVMNGFESVVYDELFEFRYRGQVVRRMRIQVLANYNKIIEDTVKSY